MKALNPDVTDGKKLMSLASESWKIDPMADYIKAKVLEMKSDDKDGDVVEMFKNAKAEYYEENGMEEEVYEVKVKDVKGKGKGKKVEEKVVEKPKGKKVSKKESEDD
jgi:hypothetical protein